MTLVEKRILDVKRQQRRCVRKRKETNTMAYTSSSKVIHVCIYTAFTL